MSNGKISVKVNHSTMEGINKALVYELTQIDSNDEIDKMRGSLLLELARKIQIRQMIFQDHYRFSITQAQAYAIHCTFFAGPGAYETSVMLFLRNLVGSKLP